MAAAVHCSRQVGRLLSVLHCILFCAGPAASSRGAWTAQHQQEAGQGRGMDVGDGVESAAWPWLWQSAVVQGATLSRQAPGGGWRAG